MSGKIRYRGARYLFSCPKRAISLPMVDCIYCNDYCHCAKLGDEKRRTARICFGISFSPKSHHLTPATTAVNALCFLIAPILTIISADPYPHTTVGLNILAVIITPDIMANHYTRCNSTIRAVTAQKLRHPEIP